VYTTRCKPYLNMGVRNPPRGAFLH
jgi:hypothetical protein